MCRHGDGGTQPLPLLSSSLPGREVGVPAPPHTPAMKCCPPQAGLLSMSLSVQPHPFPTHRNPGPRVHQGKDADLPHPPRLSHRRCWVWLGTASALPQKGSKPVSGQCPPAGGSCAGASVTDSGCWLLVVPGWPGGQTPSAGCISQILGNKFQVLSWAFCQHGWCHLM